MSLKYISVLLLISLLFIGQASAGTPYYVNGTTYPMIWNGTYASENINYMTYWSTGYDMFWNGGLLQTVWDGVYAYDKIAYPNNGTAISPWAMWHIESYNPTNKKWGETIPITNTFIKIDNSTLKRVMTMGSGETFNITYHNYGTRIKQDLELSNVLSREYRLTYRIDSVAAQDVNIDTKKFTPGFFNNFTLFDVTDVLPYTVNRTLNETSGLFEGNGSYLYGWNTTASISITDRKMYFTLTNGQVMAAGQTVLIDPSWSTNGSTTPAWQNTSTDNVTMNGLNDNNVVVGIVADYTKRANNTNLGANWTEHTDNAASIELNNIKIIEASFRWVSYNFSDNQANNYNFSFNVHDISDNNISNADQRYLIGWYIQNASNISSQYYPDAYYIIVVPYYNIVRFYKNVNGSTAQIGSDISVSTPKHGEMFTIDAGNKKVYRNGSLWATLSADTTYTKGSIGYVGSAFGISYYNGTRVWKTTSGNLTAWHDSGTGNDVYQIDVNATGNYTISYGDNSTRATQEGQTYNTTNSTTWNNNSYTVTGTKYQDAFSNITLLGNLTATPELVQVTFWTQAVSAGNQPNITSWGNNYTNNNTLLFTVPQNTNITFNATANQTLTTCSWISATQINCTADTYAYKLFDTAGTKYVNLSGSNANGSTLNSVNWTIAVEAPPPDTSFTITLPSGQTQAFFNATSKSSTNVNASGQNATVGFLYVTNTGNVVLDFYSIVTSAQPTGVILKSDIDNNPTGATTITTSLTQVISALGTSNSQYIWLWVDYSNALPMTEQRTLSVNSSQS